MQYRNFFDLKNVSHKERFVTRQTAQPKPNISFRFQTSEKHIFLKKSAHRPAQPTPLTR
jgi:hypothetical protein